MTDPTEAQRRDERIEQAARRARAAFPGCEVSVALNHGDQKRECWFVAVRDQRARPFTDFGEDLDAVLARLATSIGAIP